VVPIATCPCHMVLRSRSFRVRRAGAGARVDPRPQAASADGQGLVAQVPKRLVHAQVLRTRSVRAPDGARSVPDRSNVAGGGEQVSSNSSGLWCCGLGAASARRGLRPPFSGDEPWSLEFRESGGRCDNGGRRKTSRSDSRQLAAGRRRAPRIDALSVVFPSTKARVARCRWTIETVESTMILPLVIERIFVSNRAPVRFLDVEG
jgi:hypothetical protein